MYHPFSEIIFPGEKNLTFEDVKNFLQMKCSYAHRRDNIHEYYFGKGDFEMDAITTNQKADEKNLPVEPIGGNEFIY